MLDNINILKIASSMARHAAQRHEIISQNIANADTNGFKAKDLEPFSDAFQKTSEQANANGFSNGAANPLPEWRAIEVTSSGVTSPNGNTVSLEDQMMRSVEAQAAHDSATTIYKKTVDILRSSLGRGA